MSNAISGTTGGSYGLMQQLIGDASSTYARLQQLTTQSTTGYVAGSYAGLDVATTGSAAGALAIAPQIAGINNTVTNLQTVAGRMDIQQSTVTAISQIASKVLSQFQSVSKLSPQGMDTSATLARQALSQIGALLNTQDGSSYIFSGQNSGVAPVVDPNAITSSTFYTGIASVVAGLATNPNAAGAVLNTAAITPPFNAALGSGLQAPQVAGAAGSLITTGLVANANTLVPASPGTTPPATNATTTGSYMNDIMASLAAIGSLTTSQVGLSNFQSFAASTISTLTAGIDTMASDAGALGNNQALIATQTTSLQQTATAMSTQLAGYDQVNMTSTLSNLSSTQTQLQASYQLIAAMKTMSLTQYI